MILNPQVLPLQQFMQIVAKNLQLLAAALKQYPAPHNVKIHSNTLPAAGPKAGATKPQKPVGSPAAGVTDAQQPVGYKKALPRVWKSVVLTASIENGFTVLVGFLPAGVVMTSGYRSDADQAKVINDYFAKKKGPSTIVDVEARRQWLKTEKGLIIARVGRSPHRTGLAFDLSGAKLEQIRAAVELCATKNPTTFPLHSTILEVNQNCLHVNLKY